MKNEWKDIKVEIIEFRNSGVYILKNLEPIFEKLDEDICKVMSIIASPYVKFLESEVQSWRL